MSKTRARWLGETRRLTLRLDAWNAGSQVCMPVQTDYLVHASDATIVRTLLLPALKALKRDAGLGPKRATTRKRA